MDDEEASSAPVPRAAFSRATPILRVSDFDAAAAYYVDVLGFELAWRHGSFGCVRRDDAEVMLSQDSQGCGGTWLYLSIADADAYYEEVRRRGALVRHEPTSFPWGSRELHLFDRDGHVLRLGSDAAPGEPLGPWLDEEGVRWQPQEDGSWTRVD